MHEMATIRSYGLLPVCRSGQESQISPSSAHSIEVPRHVTVMTLRRTSRFQYERKDV